MTRTNNHSTLLRSPQGGVSGAWWFARCLLVLVLACDLLSAPFHHHHHDGGGAQLESVTSHASPDGGELHAEDADHHRAASHSAMAIRVDPSRAAKLSVPDDTDLHVVMVSVAQRLDALDEPPPPYWRPNRLRPDFSSHRSLPPASRAPPLHA